MKPRVPLFCLPHSPCLPLSEGRLKHPASLSFFHRDVRPMQELGHLPGSAEKSWKGWEVENARQGTGGRAARLLQGRGGGSRREEYTGGVQGVSLWDLVSDRLWGGGKLSMTCALGSQAKHNAVEWLRTSSPMLLWCSGLSHCVGCPHPFWRAGSSPT